MHVPNLIKDDRIAYRTYQVMDFHRLKQNWCSCLTLRNPGWYDSPIAFLYIFFSNTWTLSVIIVLFLVQLLPDFLTSEFLTIFLAKMVESDFAVTLCDGLDKPENVILIDCSINHVIIPAM